MSSSIPQIVRDRLTEKQVEALEAVERYGKAHKAAVKLGEDPSSFRKKYKRALEEAARIGWAPDQGLVKPAAHGFGQTGYTRLTTFDEKGGERVAMQYDMYRKNAEQQSEAIRETIDAWCEAAKGKIKPLKAPKDTNDALMSLYPCGDPHVGMYSWAAETGHDFDLHIAEQDLCAAVDYLVDQSPPSRRAALINLGDLFHCQNFEGETSRSGHALDTDGRLHKMIDSGVRIMRRLIHRLLEKHEQVEVINAPGNHDDVLALAMSVFLRNMYENEPRLTVHDSPTMRHYIRHGKCLIGVVHGHQTKDKDLPGIMATEKAEDWGQTKFRHYWRGHHHHDDRTEFNGCTVEQFRTLAAGDAYAVGAGYLSGRDMKCIVMHKDFGERARFTCGIDVLRAA